VELQPASQPQADAPPAAAPSNHCRLGSGCAAGIPATAPSAHRSGRAHARRRYDSVHAAPVAAAAAAATAYAAAAATTHTSYADARHASAATHAAHAVAPPPPTVHASAPLPRPRPELAATPALSTLPLSPPQQPPTQPLSPRPLPQLLPTAPTRHRRRHPHCRSFISWPAPTAPELPPSPPQPRVNPMQGRIYLRYGYGACLVCM